MTDPGPTRPAMATTTITEQPRIERWAIGAGTFNSRNEAEYVSRNHPDFPVIRLVELREGEWIEPPDADNEIDRLRTELATAERSAQRLDALWEQMATALHIPEDDTDPFQAVVAKVLEASRIREVLLDEFGTGPLGTLRVCANDYGAFVRGDYGDCQHPDAASARDCAERGQQIVADLYAAIDTGRGAMSRLPKDLAEFDGEMTCEAVPVQYSGRVDGHQWYFRARYTSFSLRVAETTTDEEDAGVNGDVVLQGEIDNRLEYAAGYMPHSLAIELIRWGLELWRRMRPNAAPDAPADPQPIDARERNDDEQ